MRSQRGDQKGLDGRGRAREAKRKEGERANFEKTASKIKRERERDEIPGIYTDRWYDLSVDILC